MDKAFSSILCKETREKFSLLIDDCFANGREENFPLIPDVKVFYLPPSCTFKIKPMDAGVIAAVKVR